MPLSTLALPSEFSTIDALRDIGRLDPIFLKQLTVQHSSGLSVLAGPGKSVHMEVETEAINKLLAIASEVFQHVVVDAGGRWELAETRLFEEASKIYLVTQVGVPELRNANRILMGDLSPHGSKVEVVMNRYATPTFGIGDEAIEKALTRRPHWRIPNDYQAVRGMQITAVPLMLKESGIQRVIRQMARAAAGMVPENEVTRKKFGFFGKTRGPETRGKLIPLDLSEGLAVDRAG